jgi:hypothetical protein|tara:strand:- start:3525 stop:3839 length:315 start_codon:yes stop_codon:yes gene_type:complete
MMDDVLKRIDALAPEYAKAKADSYQLQEFKKTQRAMLYGQAVGKTVADKEHWVSVRPEVTKTINGIAVAIEKEEKLRWELKRCELEIDIWRTEQATRRAETKII